MWEYLKRRSYQFFHNSFVHFLMGFVEEAPKWLIRLHDWSGFKGWPEAFPEWEQRDHPTDPDEPQTTQVLLQKRWDGFKFESVRVQSVQLGSKVHVRVYLKPEDHQLEPISFDFVCRPEDQPEESKASE